MTLAVRNVTWSAPREGHRGRMRKAVIYVGTERASIPRTMRNLDAAIEIVSPFVSTDETRPNLRKPARHAGHVVGTDGHTLAAARFDGEGYDLVRTIPGSEGPPWTYVIPAAPRYVGEITRSAVEPLRHFPAKWLTVLTLDVHGTAFIQAAIPQRISARGKVLAPRIVTVKRSAVDGFEALIVAEPVGVDVDYFVRCFDLATLGYAPSCYVHAAGPLDALVFAPEPCDTRDKLIACAQFAVTMPVRL